MHPVTLLITSAFFLCAATAALAQVGYSGPSTQPAGVTQVDYTGPSIIPAMTAKQLLETGVDVHIENSVQTRISILSADKFISMRFFSK